jgi:hypothetical protein
MTSPLTPAGLPPALQSAWGDLLQVLQEAMPIVQPRVRRCFPQQDITERVEAMEARLRADWPEMSSAIPLLESVSLEMVLQPAPDETIEQTEARLLTWACLLTALYSARPA